MVGRRPAVCHLKGKLGLHWFALIRVGLVLGRPKNHHFISFGGVNSSTSAPALHLFGFAKEGGEIIEVFLFPVVEWMVVAHRATNSNAKENLRSRCSKFHRSGIITEDVADGRI